jgi:sugar O-acyltransferase (sialic acid O-acetyltransferase NeuD family)
LTTLAILGAGGHGKVVADAALCAGWSDVVFFDESYPTTSKTGPWAILGTTDDFMLRIRDFSAVAVAMGQNSARLSWIQLLKRASIPAVSIAHPSSTVSRHATVGAGSVILAGAVVNPFARLGLGCIINSGATVDHDCHLEDCVHISPGAHLAGGVHVGQCTWIGIGAAVRQGIVIGRNVIVGAGAAVVGDVENGLTVVGVPARPLMPAKAGGAP